VQTYEKDGFVVQVSELEKKVTPRTKVLLLNYPNNPTGAGLSAADKKALADFAVRHDLLVLSDEIYEELNYVPRSPTIASLKGMKERTVLLSGMSKNFAMTGFRLGYACGPVEMIDAMMKIHQYSMLSAPSISQVAGLEALQNGEAEREAMRREYEERRNVIVGRLNAMGLPCFEPRGAFYVFPNIRGTGMDSVTFAKRLLKEQKVAVIPGTAFGGCGEGYVRCSYATAMEEIEEALRRIALFVGRHG
jgi:aminotransferase